MKKLALVATVAAAAVLLASSAANAASTASSASATIVAAIAISNTVGLNFGQIVPSIAIGTVAVGTDGSRSPNGGVTLSNGTLSTAASFDVTGGANSTYTIDLPASITITGPGAPMTVDAFVSNPAEGSTGALSAGGTETLLVGATLNVGVSQVAGAYTGTFNVDVVYN